LNHKGIRILLVDDSADDRFLWKENLVLFGFEVIDVESGKEVISSIDQVAPDLLLLDINMPVMNGHEVCAYLRNIPKYANLPIIMLTSSDDLTDKISSFDEGADEYITKEMDRQEIEKRIVTVIRRYRQNLDSNPLTYLPGNNVIQVEIQKRINNGDFFSVGYCDLDNFKAYNDIYGFVQGDNIIRFCAEILQRSLKAHGNPGDFLGHIGGDDFIFVTSPDKCLSICRDVITQMETGIGNFYSPEDRGNGFIISTDRQGREQKYPLVTISIAIVSNETRSIQSLAEVSEISSEVKKMAKKLPGNSYAFDKRLR
jgi:diguanylate cyclase (GGDEF)-like protein